MAGTAGAAGAAGSAAGTWDGKYYGTRITRGLSRNHGLLQGSCQFHVFFPWECSNSKKNWNCSSTPVWQHLAHGPQKLEAWQTFMAHTSHTSVRNVLPSAVMFCNTCKNQNCMHLEARADSTAFQSCQLHVAFFHSMNGHGGHGNPRDTCLKPSSCHKSSEATYFKRFFISSLFVSDAAFWSGLSMLHSWQFHRSNSHSVEFCRSMRSGTTGARKKPMRSECTVQASNWKVGYIGYTAEDVLSESCIQLLVLAPLSWSCKWQLATHHATALTSPALVWNL